MRAALSRSSACIPSWYEREENWELGTHILSQALCGRHIPGSGISFHKNNRYSISGLLSLHFCLFFLGLHVLLLFRVFPWTTSSNPALVIKLCSLSLLAVILICLLYLEASFIGGSSDLFFSIAWSCFKTGAAIRVLWLKPGFPNTFLFTTFQILFMACTHLSINIYCVGLSAPAGCCARCWVRVIVLDPSLACNTGFPPFWWHSPFATLPHLILPTFHDHRLLQGTTVLDHFLLSE